MRALFHLLLGRHSVAMNPKLFNSTVVAQHSPQSIGEVGLQKCYTPSERSLGTRNPESQTENLILLNSFPNSEKKMQNSPLRVPFV